jgi:uncharacterized OB-fold protein
MKDRIQYPHGVPRWFTYCYHHVSKRRCKRTGHLITYWSTICDHCGEITQ